MKTAVKITVFIIVLLAIAIFSAPYIAETYINKNGKELIGRKVYIDDIDLNIFNGNAEISGLNLLEEDDSSTFVSFDKLEINIAVSDLFSRKIHIEKLHISNPFISLFTKKNEYNFSSLAAADSTTVKDTIQSNNKEAYKFVLKDFKISSGEILFNNYDKNISHNIKNINIIMPHFELNDTVETELEISIEKGSDIKTKLSYLKQTGNYKLNIDIKKLKLSRFYQYTSPYINLSSVEGNLFANLLIKGNTNTPSKPKITGELGMDSLKLTDNKQLEFLSLEKFKVNTDTINLKDMTIPIDSIYFDNLTVSYQIYEKSTNLDRLLINSDEEKTAAKNDTADTSENNKINWSIKHFLVENSSLKFDDYSLNPEDFNFTLSNIKIKADSIASGRKLNAEFSSSGPEGGSIDSEISTDPDNMPNGDYDVYVKNVNAKNLSPYTLNYFAYPIESGKINLTLTNNIENDFLKSRIIIEAFNMEVGKKRKDIEAKNEVRLRTAIKVANDRNNRIYFDIPMKGDINDPHFRYRKAIVKVLTLNLVKVAASPTKLIPHTNKNPK
ncbi:MAG: DUF748 domain-containing protein [Bacteroidota bacterium]